jgi:hypothetical protein
MNFSKPSCANLPLIQHIILVANDPAVFDHLRIRVLLLEIRFGHNEYIVAECQSEEYATGKSCTDSD